MRGIGRTIPDSPTQTSGPTLKNTIQDCEPSQSQTLEQLDTGTTSQLLQLPGMGADSLCLTEKKQESSHETDITFLKFMMIAKKGQ